MGLVVETVTDFCPAVMLTLTVQYQLINVEVLCTSDIVNVYSSGQLKVAAHNYEMNNAMIYVYQWAAWTVGMEVMRPTPRTRPSRKSMRIPGRIYS